MRLNTKFGEMDLEIDDCFSHLLHSARDRSLANLERIVNESYKGAAYYYKQCTHVHIFLSSCAVRFRYVPNSNPIIERPHMIFMNIISSSYFRRDDFERKSLTLSN